MTRTIAEILAGILALAAIVILWNRQTPAPAPVDTWTPAKTAPEVKYIPKEIIKIKEVIVYRDVAKEKLDLPAEIKNDPKVHVATSVVIEPSDRRTNITTLLNESGEFTTYQKSLPYPWFKFEDTKRITIIQGWRDTQSMTRLSGSWELLQTKAFHWGVNGSIDLDGQKMVGASVSYRF